MVKINPDYICKKVTQTEFRRSYVEFEDECPCDDAALEVNGEHPQRPRPCF